MVRSTKHQRRADERRRAIEDGKAWAYREQARTGKRHLVLVDGRDLIYVRAEGDFIPPYLGCVYVTRHQPEEVSQ